MQILPIEAAGQHWVSVTKAGYELERRGPYRDADEAGAIARQLAVVCKTLFRGEWPAAAAVEPPAAKKRAG